MGNKRTLPVSIAATLRRNATSDVLDENLGLRVENPASVTVTYLYLTFIVQRVFIHKTLCIVYTLKFWFLCEREKGGGGVSCVAGQQHLAGALQQCSCSVHVSRKSFGLGGS
jgi:hypothetical protein